MSCFLGLSIQQSLTDSIYQSALSQIEDFISETAYQIIPHNTILMISSRYQKFCLPKNSQYLYSNLQHLMVSQADDEEFVETVVQCLMILKEQFPHKIEIQMISDLEQIYNLKIKIEQEIPRRLVSHLKILYDRCKKTSLTQQQLHMLVSNVGADFHKDYKQKIKNMSLRILAEAKVQPKLWTTLTNQQIKIIDDISNETIHQKMGIEVLEKILRNNNYKELPFSNKKQNMEPNSNSNASSFVEDLSIPEYDGPFDPMTALFQLKESLSISRISWVIQHIEVQKLSQKKLAKFDARIKEVIEKFLSDFYPDVPVSHLSFFGHSLGQYEMRRSNLSWDGLVEEVFLKIEEKQKQTSKGKSRLKGVNLEIR